jgi:hypothetical protein
VTHIEPLKIYNYFKISILRVPIRRTPEEFVSGPSWQQAADCWMKALLFSLGANKY